MKKSIELFEIKQENMIHIYDVIIIDVTGVQQFPVISPRENNWKLLHVCDMLPCNIGNYLIKRKSERYIIVILLSKSN